jgi:leucine dehydrogenase
MFNYANEWEALNVLRLSRGMTFKQPSGLNIGGGKAVIMGDAKRRNTRS